MADIVPRRSGAAHQTSLRMGGMRMDQQRSTSVYLNIARVLIAEIQDLPPGTRLDGINRIASRFGIARVTAERVYKHLAQLGYVRQVQGRGTFVADRRPKRITLLRDDTPHKSLALPADEEAYYRSMAESVADLLQDLGHHVEIFTRAGVSGIKLRDVSVREADLLVTIGVKNMAYLESLARQAKALISVDFPPFAVIGDFVIVDPVRTGYIATRAMLEAGRTTIWYLRIGPRILGHRIGFTMAFEDAGRHDAAQRILIGAPEADVSRLVGAVLDRRPAPEGIIAYGDELGRCVLQEARRRRLRVPQRLAILTVASRKPAEVSAMTVDHRAIATATVELIQKRLAQPSLPPQDVLLRPQFFDAGTLPEASVAYLSGLVSAWTRPRSQEPLA